MKKLILHIGTPKTGTSALQRFCQENAAALEEQGFAYPDPGGRWLRVHPSRNGQFLVQIAEAAGNRAASEQVAESVRRFNEVANSADGQTVILSDEGLWQAGAINEGGWRHIYLTCRDAGFEAIQVVVYLRRQDELVEQTWKQHIKGARRSRVRLTKMLERSNLQAKCEYDAILRELEGVFGRASITVRLYDRSLLKNGDVVDDFFETVGAHVTDAMVRPGTTVNAGISNNLTIIKRLANLSGAYRETDNFLEPAAQAVSERRREKGEPSMLSPAYRHEIIERYREGNAAIARRYLGRTDGVLFAPKPTDDDPAWEPQTAQMGQDAFLLLVDALAREHEHTRALEQRVRELERREGALTLCLGQLNRRRPTVRGLARHLLGKHELPLPAAREEAPMGRLGEQ